LIGSPLGDLWVLFFAFSEEQRMKQLWLVAAILCSANNTGQAAEPAKPAPLAGWFGVFSELPGYQRTFVAPIVSAGKKPTSYGQTVRYEWTGGAQKVLEV